MADKLLFGQPRHQFNKVTRHETIVELVDEDIVPGVLAGPRRARQSEQIGAAGDARGGARLDRRGLDLLEAEHAEQLAEAGDFLLVDRVKRLGRDVAPGQPGAAGGDDDIDVRIGDPGPQPGDDGGLVVDDDGAVDELVAGVRDALDQGLPGGVVGLGARVRNGQHRDVDRDEAPAALSLRH